MTAPPRRQPPRSGFVYWARAQMRGLDRWSSKAIVLLCFIGILAHAVIHHH